MKIVQLTAENIKRLKAVEITPDGTLQIIGGRNSQGKSSVMDAIWLALGGGAASKAIDEPVRHGEDHAMVRLDLGDLIVTRIWKGDRSELKIESPATPGAKFSSPQELLNNLLGKFTFDPLEFTRLSEKDQVTELLKVVDLPINLEAQAASRKALYDQRTDAGREVKRLEAQLAGFAEPEPFLPTVEVSVAELAAEYQKALQWQTEAELCAQQVADLVTGIAGLQAKLVEAQTRLSELKTQTPPTPESIKEQMDSAEVTNKQIRSAKQRAEIVLLLDQARESHKSLDMQIDSLDQEKADALANVTFPVPGLGFTEDGVTFNGIPFSQASSSEQIRVSLGLAMAFNPKLRVLRIMDGSLLDEDNMALIANMAAENEYQIWVETVGDHGVGVIIEDGMVKE